MNKFNEPWIMCRSHEDADGPMFEIAEDDRVYYEDMPYTRIVTSKDETVVTAHDLFQFKPEHAKRIIACVNAMAGIDDPAAFVAKHKGNP